MNLVERCLWAFAIVLVALLAADKYVEARDVKTELSVMKQTTTQCVTMDRVDKLLSACELVSQTNAKCIDLHEYVRARLEMKHDADEVRGIPIRAHERGPGLGVHQVGVGGAR